MFPSQAQHAKGTRVKETPKNIICIRAVRSWNTGHRRPWYIVRFHNNLCYLKCNSGGV